METINALTVNKDTGEVINESVIVDADLKQFQESRNSPYKRFVQLNDSTLSALREINKQSHIAGEIVLFMIEHMDKYNALVCSQTVLCEALGYGRTNISNALKILKDSNIIKIKRSGTTNVYLFNKHIAWKSWGKNYKYAEFGAKVILSETEQKEPIETKHVSVVDIRHKR